MNLINRNKQFFKSHPFGASILIAFLLGLLLAIILTLVTTLTTTGDLSTINAVPFLGTLFAIFLIYPFELTIIQIILLCKRKQSDTLHKQGRWFDITTLLLGIIYSILYLAYWKEVEFTSDWNITLINNQLHTPIYTGASLTIIVIGVIGILGYCIVNYIPLEKMPPLVMVLGISAMYLGTIESIVWCIQTVTQWDTAILLLLPLNCICITARTLRDKISQWKTLSHSSSKIDRIPVLQHCNGILQNANYWPVAAFFFMWPLLGILICILLLFGQAPNAIIQAWTETSDWALSQQIAPQNIHYDQHYLCTVAAGGHKKIVKPLRLGIRHGHQVIVNRQLCIANAFEQIFEEKTPRFHKVVRHLYDTYGFPIAKLIRSQYIADTIYYLMKPLEWLFLLVLYLVDVHPEDRIAIQYTGKRLKDFSHGDRDCNTSSN